MNSDSGAAGKTDPGASQSETNIPTSFPLRLPKSMRIQANELSRIEGISLNQFIAIAVAEKLVRIESSCFPTLLLDENDSSNDNGRRK